MYDEIFSSEPPIPAGRRGKTPPPEITTESKPKRKYTRKQVKQAEPVVAPIPEIQAINDDEALIAAERLFDDEQLLGYYTISTFIRLYDMVKPTDRKELAKIVEGLVANPRRIK